MSLAFHLHGEARDLADDERTKKANDKIKPKTVTRICPAFQLLDSWFLLHSLVTDGSSSSRKENVREDEPK